VFKKFIFLFMFIVIIFSINCKKTDIANAKMQYNPDSLLNPGYLYAKFAQNPQDSVLVFALAENYYLAQQYDSSVKYYHLLTQIAQRSAKLYNSIGNCYTGLANYRDAKTYYQMSIRTDPNYIPPAVNLANTFRSIGMIEEAKTQYLQVIEKDPGYWIAYINLGHIYFQGKTPDDLKKARENYQNAYEKINQTQLSDSTKASYQIMLTNSITICDSLLDVLNPKRPYEK